MYSPSAAVQTYRRRHGKQGESVLSTAAITTAKEVFDLLRDDLVAIEQEFERLSTSDVDSITEIAGYLREGGGKRIRPALLLLAAKALGHTGNSSIRLGAVVEMVHTATLVHDDIIDVADIRRGRPSANTQWGNSKCVLAGDWLYMQAFRVALEERNFRILDLLINLTQQMVEGELLQMERLGTALSEHEYYELIYRKTACLFRVSMQLGCVLGGASQQVEEILGDYGRNLGLAFQIVDDVLDLTASEEVLGKPTASDLREGKATLAVVHALHNGTLAERADILAVIEDQAFDRVSHQRIVAILQRNGSIDYAMQAAYSHAEAARKNLEVLPESEFKRALLWVPDFVVAREK
jgi:octaprenyl-diphosphate synthase